MRLALGGFGGVRIDDDDAGQWVGRCTEASPGAVRLKVMLTAFGASAVTFMMVMYALERRDPRFVLAFACGCVLSSVYGFLAGTWPFGIVEAIWAGVAVHRYRRNDPE